MSRPRFDYDTYDDLISLGYDQTEIAQKMGYHRDSIKRVIRDRDKGPRVPTPRKPAEHGTYSGYKKHLRVRTGDWDVPACEPCQAAKRAIKRRQLAGDTDPPPSGAPDGH